MSRRLAISLPTVATLVGLCLSMAGFAVESKTKTRETAIRTVLLIKFMELVEWPAAAQAQEGPLYLCILGEDPFGEALTALLGHRVRGREFVVRRFAAARDLDSCSLLFVGLADAAQQREVLKALGKLPVLTVADGKEFALGGGMIGLVRRVNGVGYLLNLEAMKAAGLKPDHDLIRLASRVLGKQGR